MAKYKVSYKVLRQQGEDMKAAAKLIDGYAERVNKIRGKLGSDNMLAEIRNNLQKLAAQLGESRAVLNTAGELLIKNVENYGGVEMRQVKKVDGMRAHNRDFYKNPVVVASAGGAAAGGAVAGATASATASAGGASTPSHGASSAAPSPAPEEATAPEATYNYTDNSVNVTYANAEPAASAPIQEAQPVTAQPVVAQAPPVTATAPPKVAVSPVTAAAQSTAAKVGAGAAGGAAVAAGSIFGGREIKKHMDEKEQEDSGDTAEAELENARRRLSELT